MLYRDNVTDNETTAYIPGSGGIRLKNGVPDFTHKDHLGSPVAMTDASGTVLWREMYSPFGLKQVDPAANRDNEGFTGHIDDDASGLTYMQARFYDPNIGRFLSNDPVGFSVDQPQMFGRYTYTYNDPANMIDPDGELAFLAICAGPQAVICLGGGAIIGLAIIACALTCGDDMTDPVTMPSILPPTMPKVDEREDSDVHSYAARESRRKDQCIRECTESVLESPDRNPINGRSGDDFSRCVADCMARKREEEGENSDSTDVNDNEDDDNPK